MTDHSLPYLVNCSLMFTEEPLLRRPAAARAAGFSAVEFWWPFATPVPPDRDGDAFVAAVSEAGVALVGLNFFAGDLAGPDCGVLSIPGRSGQFRDNIDVVAGIGERRGGGGGQRPVREPGRWSGPGRPGRAGGGEHRTGGEGRGLLRRHGADRAGERP